MTERDGWWAIVLVLAGFVVGAVVAARIKGVAPPDVLLYLAAGALAAAIIRASRR